MDQALSYLLDLLSSEWEYPDAEWKTVRKYSVNAEELRRAYDDHCVRAYVLNLHREGDRLTRRSDWTCHHCRQTWAGGTQPASGHCPDCGQILDEEPI